MRTTRKTSLETPPLQPAPQPTATASPEPRPSGGAAVDHFAGTVADPGAKHATERLAHPRRSGNALVDAHTKSPKKKTAIPKAPKALLPLVPRFSDTVQTLVGPVDLPAIAGVAVKGEVFHFEGVRSAVDPSAHLTVRGTLGRLTAAEFQAVHAALGGRSHVAFDAGREYSVQDFLPPVIQALVNEDLEVPEMIKLKGSKPIGEEMATEDFTVGLTMNCHATAWEAARAYQGDKDDVSIFYGEMITMDGRVAGEPQDFEKLGEATAEKIQDLAKLDLHPGDILQFFEITDWARMTTLLHSATYVGGGLFFEKPNTEGADKEDPANYVTQEETPFRLGTLEMIAKPVGAWCENKFRAEVYRPKTPMPEAEEAFESSLEPATIAWAARKGKSVGVELVTELEQGMGGGIHAEHMSALVRLPLAVREDGTSKLA